jgi:hypothetical protein
MRRILEWFTRFFKKNKKNKIKNVLALTNELQVQDSSDSDDDLHTPKLSKTAMMWKLAQAPPEILIKLLVEAKKWFLNERKRKQQQEANSIIPN